MIAKIIAALAVFVAGCAGQIVADPPADPVCTTATFEAGADRSTCPDAGVNPIVTECDRPATAAELVRFVGVDSTCSAGTQPNTYCCM
jgi:hypothetical protein